MMSCNLTSGSRVVILLLLILHFKSCRGYDVTTTVDTLLQQPIKNLTAETELAFVGTNVTFDLSIHVDAGAPLALNASVWRDGGMVSEHFLGENLTAWDGFSATVSMMLAEAGVHTVMVHGWNDVSAQRSEWNVTVQNRLFGLSVDAPDPIPYLGDPVVVNVTFDLEPTLPPPTDLSLELVTGDGQTISLPNWGHGQYDYTESSLIQVTYQDHGVYLATLRLYNGVSDRSVIFTVMILENITGVNVTYHSGSYFISPDAAVLPVEYPVFFTCSLWEGTVQWVTWEIANQNLTNATTATCDWSYTFPDVGTHTVTANVGNNFSEDSVSTEVTVIESVGNLLLVNDGPVLLGQDIIFILFAETLGLNSTFSLSFGDGHTYEFSDFSKNVSIMEFVKPGLLLPFDPTQQFSRIIRHHYLIEGSYLAAAYGWNLVSSLSTFSEVKVNLKPCDIPLLEIRSGSPDFASAPRFHRNRAITLHADIEVDCQGSDVTIYRWRVYRIDELFPYPSIANEILFGESTRTDLVECYIPPFTLRYGEYITEIAVTTIMNADGSVGMVEYDQSYIKVVPTSLIPRITGGSLRVASWTSELVLDGSSSYDPDLSSSSTHDPNLDYRWYCRRANETFPEINETLHEVIEDYQCATCGCFSSGFLVSSDSSPASSVSSSLRFPEMSLEDNSTYIFRLEVSKDGRDLMAAEQMVRILPGNVTDVLIRCVINCDIYVNPSERLVLSGRCEHCPQSSRPSYDWSIVADDSDLDVVDWNKDTTTGRNKAYLAIKGGVLARYNIPRYTVRLTMHSLAGVASHAEFSVQVNFPPSRGTCFVAPTEGFVLFTYYYISCSMFTDVDTPLGYQIRVLSDQSDTSQLQDYSQGSLLFFGLDPLFPPTMLPLGSATNNYAVTLAIIATDAFGASVVTHLNATVRPPLQSSVEVFEKLVNLTQGEGSEVNHLLQSGDTQAATQLITSVSSILNSETERADGGTEGTSKDARIQVRDQLITDLDRVDIRDLESIQLTSAAVAEVTREGDEVSTASQLSASTIYQKMGSTLQEQSNTGATSVTIEASARQLVSGVAHIMGASSKQLGNNTQVEGDETSQNLDDSTAENSRRISLASVDSLKNIEGAILRSRVPGEDTFIIKTEEVDLLLDRLEKQDVDGRIFEVPGKDAFIKLPDNFGEALEERNNNLSGHDVILDTHVRHFTHNPFSWAGRSEVTSQVIAIDLAEGNDNNHIEVTDLQEPINIFLDNVIDERVVTLDGELDYDTGETLFGFNVTEGVTHIMMQFKIRNRFSGDEATDLNVTIVDGLNDTEEMTVMTFSLPNEPPTLVRQSEMGNVTGDPYSILLEREVFGEDGTYYMDVQVGGAYNWSNEWNVTVLVYSPRCVFWEETTEEWNSHGCQPGPLTNLRHTHCLCDHLSTFGGTIVPLPNAIHFRDDIRLFTEVFENPVTAITVVTILLVFAICAYWARRKDLNEEKAEVIFLADNDPEFAYQYHITIITGMRRSSGTTSTATITLQGSRGFSDPHVLAAPHRPVLQRASRDSFMISTQGNLGALTGVRLWHDNTGSNPDWYISRVIVHDLQTNSWWYFLCQSWLSLSFGESCIDMTFPVATPEDLTHFHHLFLSGMQRDISEYHLWVSVVVHPPQSRFTRLQRAACCLCITFTAMLASIIFYGVPEEYSTVDSSISFGSLSLSWTSVIIGIESSIVTVPINYFICELFRNARGRPRHHRLRAPSAFSFSSLSESSFQTPSAASSSESENLRQDSNMQNSEAVERYGNNEVKKDSEHAASDGCTSNLSDADVDDTLSEGRTQLLLRRNRHLDSGLGSVMSRSTEALDDHHRGRRPDAAGGNSASTSYGTAGLSIGSLVDRWEVSSENLTTLSQHDKVEESQGCLPWWSIYISWVLVFLTCLVCSFFIVLYGLRYGKQQSVNWLVAMLVSLFQSATVIQPLNVVILAALFAILMPKHTHDVIGLGTSHVINARAEVSSGGNLPIPLHLLRQTHYYQPPTNKRIQKAREKRLKKAQMYSVLKAFLGHVAFIVVVFEMAYLGRDPNTYLMQQALANSFTGNAHEVQTAEDVLFWLRDVFEPAFYGGSDGFIVEDFAFRLGGARVRQLRTKQGICWPHSLLGSLSIHCEEELDTGSYNASWAPGSSEVNLGSPWLYQSAKDILGSKTNKLASSIDSGWSRSPETGGFILYLGMSINITSGQIDYLEASGWLDVSTRAVFVEWNLFNPNTNLLCACCMLFERSLTGAFGASLEFDVMKPVDIRTPYDKISLSLESIYMLVVVVLILIEVQRYRKDPQNYWRFWNALTILIILLSLTAAVVYSISLLETYVSLKCHRLDPDRFCSFFRSAFLTRVFNHLIAAIVFFASIKCIKILRYNKSIHLMQMTWYHLAERFKMSLVVVLIVFAGFALLAYLLFGDSIRYFSSFISSFESLFVLVSGSFDQLPDITQNYRVVSMLFLVMTVFVLIYIFMNLMIIFIIESFLRAQERCRSEVDHRDVVGSFAGWVSSWFGVKGKTNNDLEEEWENEITNGESDLVRL